MLFRAVPVFLCEKQEPKNQHNVYNEDGGEVSGVVQAFEPSLPGEHRKDPSD